MEICPGRCLALIAITALHAVLAVVLTLYPFIVPSNAYDGVYVTVALLIVAHWIVLDYDCLISVYEKRLVDEGYVAGSAPFHQWWMDSIGDDDIVMSTRILFWGAIAASVIAIARRNTRASLSDTSASVSFVFRFGSAGRLTKTILWESKYMPSYIK